MFEPASFWDEKPGNQLGLRQVGRLKPPTLGQGRVPTSNRWTKAWTGPPQTAGGVQPKYNQMGAPPKKAHPDGLVLLRLPFVKLG